VGITNTFTATVVPTDVIQPITYVWQASGQIPVTHTAGLSDTISYLWDDPGTQAITITAINVQGSTTDTLSLPILMPPANLIVTGAEVGDVQDSYTFTATVTPLTTTIPITYLWTVDGQIPITHTTGVVDTAAFSWDSPGIYHLSVSATNQAGSVEATWSITIFVKVYLPITFRQ
jgi:transposase InsO family protein